MLVHSWLSRNVLPALAGLGVIVAATPLPASAQHAAHEHGVARLSAALEGGELLLEFLTPLDNLVGFEHAPTTAAQRQALADAAARLREGGRLFVLPEAAACVQRTVEIEAPWLSEVEGARGHDHDHEHEHAGEARGHADLVASYQFVCGQPAALDTLDTRLFEFFPRLHEIRAERATPHGQGATVLRPGATTMAF